MENYTSGSIDAPMSIPVSWASKLKSFCCVRKHPVTNMII